jgi:hypothetical protein
MWQLFNKLNPNYKEEISEGLWDFINSEKESWSTFHKNLDSCLESLKSPHICKNLCIFVPELVSPDYFSIKSFLELCELIHSYRAMH